MTAINPSLLLAAPLAGLLMWSIASIALSALARRRSPARHMQGEPTGSVALLYLTCDDFNPRACCTLLDQEDVECDVFILDDSTHRSKREEIDLWVRAHHGTTRTLRRADRSGYKAGNLNHWLARFGSTGYRYILLADADEHLPRDFTRRLLEYLHESGHAFAQGCHIAAPGRQSRLQRLLQPEVECRWFHQNLGRNLLGSAPILGHGVLLCTDNVKRVGGFPTLLSEDLALTIRLSERGLTGRIVPDAIAGEELPETYWAYWGRKRRWIQADMEVVRNLFACLLRSELRWLGRVDLAIRELRFPLATAQWLLLTWIAFGHVSGRPASSALPPASWALLALFLAPALTALAITRLSAMRRCGFVAAAMFVGAATSALHPVAAARGLRGHGRFEPTGAANRGGHCRGSVPWVCWEASWAALLLAGGVLGTNLSLVAVGFAVACSPLMRTGLENATLPLGLATFWALVGAQIWIDLGRGHVPVEHLLPLLGLLVT